MLSVEGERVQDFDALCADGARLNGLGSFSVVVIEEDSPDDRHSVAALQVFERRGKKVVVAKNSWGSASPRLDITEKNYHSHYTIDVKIAKCTCAGDHLISAIAPIRV